MTEAAKRARREYNRQYYHAHKEQIMESKCRYWERKAKEMKEKQRKAKYETEEL